MCVFVNCYFNCGFWNINKLNDSKDDTFYLHYLYSYYTVFYRLSVHENMLAQQFRENKRI